MVNPPIFLLNFKDIYFVYVHIEHPVIWHIHRYTKNGYKLVHSVNIRLLKLFLNNYKIILYNLNGIYK